MCGIAVCIGRNSDVDMAKFEKMVDIVNYRGPDDRGVYKDGLLALGHRRLAIIDLTEDGHQPFEQVDGFVLVFNGEIYNYLEIRAELEKEGYRFKTNSDTEIIIHAYKKWGTECVEHFNGMWAFALYDIADRLIFCSRDRFGVKPLYYTDQDGMFMIASEIKQFFEMTEEAPVVNRDALAKYIIRGDMDAPPFTLYDSIYQLEPGHNLVYELTTHSFKKNRYYMLDTREDDKIPYSEACELFKRFFVNSVELRLRSDVPVGYFLSGGLDSSSIVCVADRLQKENRNKPTDSEQIAISSCYREKKYDEQEYIDAVVKATNVNVKKVFPEDGIDWEVVDKIIWHMDEPFFGMSGVSQWHVCRAAGERGLKVVLDGQGSDEQLAGYNDFYEVFFVDLLKKCQLKKLKNEIVAYNKIHKGEYNVFGWHRIVLSAVKTLITPESFDKLVKQIYYRYFSRFPFDRELIKKALDGMKLYPRRDAKRFVEAYMTDELVSILHNLDRKTMAFSIESREPFLDYRLVENVCRMPISYKIRKGWTKAVLRDGMTGFLPLKIKERKTKLAFVAPVEKWVNDNRVKFREELEKSLNRFEVFLDKKKVLGWYDKKKHLTLSECNLVWRIIVSGRWMDVFNVRI